MAVAFSGGVDSTLLGWAAREALGPQAILVTADSESYAEGELDEARQLAKRIGLPHLVVQTRELDNPEYAANPPNRCFFCKEELFARLEPHAQAEGLGHLVYGATVDDLGDHRPGMAAARQRGVVAPLIDAGLGKVEIRELSHAAGLPTWDRPAMACLSSRFPYGTTITAEKLRQVDRAEAVVRAWGSATSGCTITGSWPGWRSPPRRWAASGRTGGPTHRRGPRGAGLRARHGGPPGHPLGEPQRGPGPASRRRSGEGRSRDRRAPAWGRPA